MILTPSIFNERCQISDIAMIFPLELVAFITMIICQYEYSMARIFFLINKFYDRSTGLDTCAYILMLDLLERGKRTSFSLKPKLVKKYKKN